LRAHPRCYIAFGFVLRSAENTVTMHRTCNQQNDQPINRCWFKMLNWWHFVTQHKTLLHLNEAIPSYDMQNLQKSFPKSSSVPLILIRVPPPPGELVPVLCPCLCSQIGLSYLFIEFRNPHSLWTSSNATPFLLNIHSSFPLLPQNVTCNST
jgi:hypothetical protein